MIECTFINEKELERAEEVKHIHWNHLKEKVQECTENMFYLYHFSSRHSVDEITEFFKEVARSNIILL